MKINYKKIIAREFLFLIGSLIISLIFVFIAHIKMDKNIENKNELANISKLDSLPKRLKTFEITLQIDSQNEFPQFINKITSFTGFPNKKIFIKNMKNENTASLFYDNIVTYFKVKNDKKTFIKLIKEDTDKSEKTIEKISEIKNEINSYKNSFKFDYEIIIILFSTTFFLRYLIYSIRWSINQLKQPN